MENEKYTYKDWWNGTVYLETCPTVSPKDSNLGIKTNLNQFSKKEALKIKKKQKELFDKQRNQKLKAFINTFKKRLKNSDAKEAYLKREFADVNNIISSSPGLSPRFNNWNTSISREDLAEMRKYVNEQIIKGEKNYDFMHSPKYIFQAKSKTPPEIYARVSWDYFKWLNSFVESLNKKYSISGVKAPRSVEKAKDKIGVPVIALMHFYNKITINRNNCTEIALNYGYNSKSSGEGLFQDYTKYSKNANRLGINDDSHRKNETKQKHLINVIKLLKGHAKKHAQQDLLKLEKSIQEMDN